jgi:hypothetical protein
LKAKVCPSWKIGCSTAMAMAMPDARSASRRKRAFSCLWNAPPSVARLPFASEVTTCSGPDCAAELALEAIPAIVYVLEPVPKTI